MSNMVLYTDEMKAIIKNGVKSKNISQKHIAEELNVSYLTVNRVVNGYCTKININILKYFDKLLGTELYSEAINKRNIAEELNKLRIENFELKEENEALKKLLNLVSFVSTVYNSYGKE